MISPSRPTGNAYADCLVACLGQWRGRGREARATKKDSKADILG